MDDSLNKKTGIKHSGSIPRQIRSDLSSHGNRCSEMPLRLSRLQNFSIMNIDYFCNQTKTKKQTEHDKKKKKTKRSNCFFKDGVNLLHDTFL